MKKTRLVLLFLFLLALSMSVCAENSLDRIDIDVRLNADGSAQVEQVWTGFFDTGTECYIPVNTDGITVKNLTVSSDIKEYETVGQWNIESDFEGKAYKCGLNPVYNGVELCFGISNYGERVYTIRYTVDNLLCSYKDADGFNFMFINKDFGLDVRQASVEISLADGKAISDSMCDIWAFGFDGNIEFDSGKISAYTQSPLGRENGVIIMARFDKGHFNPSTHINKSFDTVKKKAFKGSDYSDVNVPFILYIMAGIFVTLVLSAIIYVIVDKFKLNRFIKSCDYFRDIPNGGNLNVSYLLAKDYLSCHQDRIMGAMILKEIANGNLSPAIFEEVGLFGRVKETTSLKIENEFSADSEISRKFYKILSSGAGEDNILQEKEMERYCQENYDELRSFFDMCESDGRNALVAANVYKGAGFTRFSSLTDKGREELSQIAGLKKFLKDFSLIDERTLPETVLWQSYMVYAFIFGIADRVAKQLKNLYPEIADSVEAFEAETVFAGNYASMMYTSMCRQEMEMQSRRSSGSGGSASFGGGGGFSGGGVGGGTR